MITTIIFDFYDVYMEGIIGSHKYFEKKLDTPVPEEYFYNEGHNKFMLGQITEDKYWESVIKMNSWNISVNLLKNAARKNFTEIKGTREIIERLQKQGYTLALLSNHGKEWAEYCERKYSYHKFFRHVVYSFQVGITKPNKEIFLLVLKKLQVKPQECLFIDDYKNNILAAESLGMKAIQFISPADLKKKLTKVLNNSLGYVAIDFSDTSRQMLFNIVSQKFPEKDYYHSSDPGYTYTYINGNVCKKGHLTICYGIKNQDLEKRFKAEQFTLIRQKIIKIKNIQINLGYKGEYYVIIAIPEIDKDIFSFDYWIRQNNEIAPDALPFDPHITLCYIKNQHNDYPASILNYFQEKLIGKTVELESVNFYSPLNQNKNTLFTF